MGQNLLIIGAGPAGEAAAKTAAKSGAVVTVIEKEEAGGLCLNKGCVPSKTLLEQIRKMQIAAKKLDWPQIQQFKRDVVGGLRSQLESSLKTLKVKLLKGTAAFNNKSSLRLTTSTGPDVLPFDKAIIASGTDIFFPPPLDKWRGQIWDSDTMLDIDRTPDSVAIIGGGAVGCEFACLLEAIGTRVILIEMKETLLPGEDPAIAGALANSFEKRGIQIYTQTVVRELKKKGKGWQLLLSNGHALEAEQVLACAGRCAKPEPLALEKAGIQFDRRGVIVNDRLQTSNPNVFAAGDITGGSRLAHAAAAQGKIAALNALGKSAPYDESLLPRCLYSWPEVASVGKFKDELEKEKRPVKTSRAFFKGSAKALAAEEAEGFVQIVSDAEQGQILGAQIIGAHATELIHIFSVAMKKNMTVGELGEIIFAHPTLSEVIRDAANR